MYNEMLFSQGLSEGQVLAQMAQQTSLCVFLAVSEGSPYVRMCHTISTYSAPFGVSDPDLNGKTVALVGETRAGNRPAMLELGD